MNGDIVRTGVPTERSFTIVRRLAAPKELVYSAWTQPDQLSAWYANLPPREPVTVDLQVGGAWRLEMRENEDKSYVTGGVYRRIEAPDLLEFSLGAVGGWPDLDLDRLDDVPLVTITLAEMDGGTEMVVRVSLSDQLSDEQVQRWFAIGIRQGMTETVDRITQAPAIRRP